MIPFLDLKAANRMYEPALTRAIMRVVESGWYLLGDELAAFEQAYAEYIGSRHCIGVGSGLDALRLLLRAHIELDRIAEGDEVIVPANTYIATILAISESGLVPVLVEPDIGTYNIDPYAIESGITEKTRAIMLVHLYGRNAMTAEIAWLVKEYGLLLFEDNAQAHGCIQGSRRTGSLGDAAGHSFYPTKNLGALGDGGAVTTDDDDLAQAIRSLRNYGTVSKHVNHYKGCNSRLDEIQSAVLRVKLAHLDRDNERRRAIAAFYREHVTNPHVVLPEDDSSHVWHLFVIRCKERDRLQKHLSDCGVQTVIHYPIPPHRQTAYVEWDGLELPVTERIHREVLSLPLSPALTDRAMQTVCDAVNSFRLS